MGMVYRRKKRDSVTGLLVEQGPWWMKFYDNGRPVYLGRIPHFPKLTEDNVREGFLEHDELKIWSVY